MIKKCASILTILTVFTLASHAETTVYKIDPVHSGIQFKIRHFLNKVPGTFTGFTGEIHLDKENPANSKAFAEIEVQSVDTRNEDRDAHLQNEDFFKSSEFPRIGFASTEWIPLGDGKFKVKGLLTILGKANPVELDVSYLGEMEGYGVMRSGWEGSATIDRRDWGMTYGQPAVGTEVDIELNIQAHRPLEKKEADSPGN
ncbi:MAG: YceI family protein [Oceanipulchritudo sp.]